MKLPEVYKSSDEVVNVVHEVGISRLVARLGTGWSDKRMNCRAGFVWQTKQHFNRYIEDCGIPCELITPHMLAAPFYRGRFNCLIIPTGFANPAYSNLLPALRAAAPRIKKFVENGGNLLVFGAAANKPDSYDWLPFPVTYCHDCHPRRIESVSGS